MDISLVDLFDDLPSGKMNSKKMLKVGLWYPDLPCSIYKFKGDWVTMVPKNKCSITRFAKILSSANEYDEIFQSHHGIYAFLHSMTYDPEVSADALRKRILHKLMASAVFAAYDNTAYANVPTKQPNIFWIGMIMHTIQDSYALSHTVRTNKQLPDYVVEKESERHAFKRSFRTSMFNLARSHAHDGLHIHTEDELQSVLMKQYKDQPEILRYIDKRGIHKLFKAYKLYMFDVQSRHTVQHALRANNMSKLLGCKHGENDKYDIRAFQYYKGQSAIYHTQNDLISRVKSLPGMYERMVSECVHLLRLFRDMAIGHITVGEYLQGVHMLLACRVFKMKKM